MPELRTVQANRVFNGDLARLDYDLNAWRCAISPLFSCHASATYAKTFDILQLSAAFMLDCFISFRSFLW